MDKQFYRPEWVEPKFLAEQGYKLINDNDGYLKYESSWELKAITLRGKKHEQLLGNGKRLIFFNTGVLTKEEIVMCSIREDGDTRTVFQGYIDSEEFLIKLLDNVF